MNDPFSSDLESGFIVWSRCIDKNSGHIESKTGIVIKVTSLVWFGDKQGVKKSDGPPNAWTADVLVENEIHHLRVERRDIIATI